MKVLALVVTDGVTTYLSDTLSALQAQERQPDHTVVIDHSEAEAQELRDFFTDRDLGSPHVLSVTAPTLGEAVRRGIATLQTEDEALAGENTWLWLLHDDSAPQDDALKELAHAVELSPSLGIAGCKQVGFSGSPLISVGYTTSRFGRRLSGIEEGEVDQGQHDHRDDVLAVGTAGMLISWEAWNLVGGPDPALGPFMDGQDLSRKVRLAGYRTVVVPSAVVRHDRASYSLRRTNPDVVSHTGARRAAFRRKRQEFVHFQITAAPLLFTPFIAVIAIVAGVVRSLARLALKEPRMMSAELRAPLTALGSPLAIIKGRARLRRSSRLPRRTLRPLQATWREVFTMERDRRQQRAAARRAVVIRDELDIAERAQRAAKRRIWLTVVLVLSAAMTLFVLGPLLTAGQLAGGALAPSHAGVRDLWHAATSGYIATGFGHAGPANPLLLVLLVPASAGSLLGINLGGVIAALIILSIPAAALTAWMGSGAITRSPATRGWVALMWSLAPALHVALSDGRLGILLAHVFLPLVVLGAVRGAGKAVADTSEQLRPEGSVAAAAGGSLALIVVVASVPSLLPASLLIFIIAAIAAGKRWSRMVLMVLPALAVMGPYLTHALRHNLAILGADSGIPTGYTPAQSWQLALGFPESPADFPWFSSGLLGTVGQYLAVAAAAVVVALAVGAFVRRSDAGKLTRAGWVIALIGFVTVMAQVRFTWMDDVATWPSGTLLIWLGFLGAAVALSRGQQQRLQETSFGWRQVVAGVCVTLAAAAPIILALNTAGNIRNETTPLAIEKHTNALVPAVVSDSQSSAERPRTLILDVHEDRTVSYRLLHRPVVDFIDRSAVKAGVALDDVDDTFAQTVAALTTTPRSETVEELAKYGISDVLVQPQDPDSVDPRGNLIATLDATADLERVTANQYGILWRVNAPDIESSWARIEGPDGIEPLPAARNRIQTNLSVDSEDRTVVLAERASDRWRAWVDGKPRPSVSRDDGLQAFTIPKDGGNLVVAFRPADRTFWIITQGLTLLITALLAIPMRRRRGGGR